MRLGPFRIEQYYARYEFSARYMLSSADAQTRSIGELLAREDALERFQRQALGYTEAPGSLELRDAVSTLYDGVRPDDVVVVSCAEEGIFLVYHALLGPGDHVVVETPCFESALELARSTGAVVSEWRRRAEDRWAHDLDVLESLLRPNTRLLYVTTPHNPTGLVMRPDVYRRVVALARDNGIVVFGDEIYRELEHEAETRLPAVCDELESGVSLGSMSKAYGLPGLRLGWLVTRTPEILRRVLDLKFYTTICNSAPSEFLSALALRQRRWLLDRNLGLVLRNLALLDGLFERHEELFSRVRPDASPIGFARLQSGDADGFCRGLLEATSVLLLPGSVYDEPDHVRFGYGRENMPEALTRLEAYLARP